VGFCNCITIYKGRREGGGGSGSEEEFLRLGGKAIIVSSYISMEGCGKGWEGG
jgi:hypothetical protein